MPSEYNVNDENRFDDLKNAKSIFRTKKKYQPKYGLHGNNF